MPRAGAAQTFDRQFFNRPTLDVAPELLGVVLCRRLPDGTVLQAPIVEVEAYTHDDPACHAWKGLTERCAVMFGPPGHAYVYFIYGMYHCLNVVTEQDGTAGAVLIRAIGTTGGEGPGKLCRLWQINKVDHNGADLTDARGPLWLEKGRTIERSDISISPRVGLSVAQENLWRFFVKDSEHVSVRKVKPHVRRKR